MMIILVFMMMVFELEYNGDFCEIYNYVIDC